MLNGFFAGGTPKDVPENNGLGERGNMFTYETGFRAGSDW